MMIYFDNAATSYPKPPNVYRTLSEDCKRLGGNPSRSGHFLSMQAAEEVFRCRVKLAEFFGAEPENTVFTLNATHALNTAIKGIAESGDHFIISNMEHNAVLRPVHKLSENLGCTYSIANVIGREDEEIIAEIERLILPNTRAVVMTHASNLCSFKIPAAEIGALCQRHGIIFVLDASQSAGHEDIDIHRDRIDILCAPAHKGLYGIMGLGFLITNGKVKIDSLAEGGSGYNSASMHMPEELPEHLEAGTLPIPAISALRSGICEVERIGISEIKRRECELFSLMRDGLSRIPEVEIYLPEYSGACLLFNIRDIPAAAVDAKLQKRGVCVRSGLHCCPLGHMSIGTGEYGAVRVSFGIHNRRDDIFTFTQIIRETVHDMKKISERRYP